MAKLHAKKSVRFAFIPFELCIVGSPPNDANWVHEIKLDGYRIEALIKNKNVSLISRNQIDWTSKFPAIAQSLQQFPAQQVILDGELVALDKRGFSRFELLQNYEVGSSSLVYYVFDVLHYEGQTTLSIPLINRKILLSEIFKKWKKKPDNIRLNEFFVGKGTQLFAKACKLGLEGVISKRSDSLYVSKRSGNWIKSKCLHEDEFVIGGFTKPKGNREGFGALLLGTFKGKELVYSGKVGTGFNDESLQSIYKKITSRLQSKSSFTNAPAFRDAYWIKPDLIARIRFSEKTQMGRLRKPVFLGLVSFPRKRESSELDTHLDSRFHGNDKNVSASNTTHIPVLPRPTGEGKVDPRFREDDSRLTHPNKLLYTSPDITKGEVLDYYLKIADWILPHIINRPLSLLRCPEGIYHACFYQKHFTKDMKNIYPVLDPSHKKEAPYLMIKDAKGLAALVQMSVLEIHPWNCQIRNINKPDRIIFDLDPSEDVSWDFVRESAFIMRDLLQLLKLISFVKTTGGKGLHVVLPIKAQHSYDEVKSFVKIFVDSMATRNPKKYVTNMSKKQRKAKIFLDYLRNYQGSTAIASYAIRARTGACVATPITWEELQRLKSPQEFNYKNIHERLQKLNADPWENFFELKQILPRIR